MCDQGNSSVNIPVIRYSEVLLIYAEALNELNGGPILQTGRSWGKSVMSDYESPNIFQGKYLKATIDLRQVRTKWKNTIYKRLQNQASKPNFAIVYTFL